MTRLARRPSAEPQERPLLFSGPMVVALLSGRKTQTRRIIANPPPFQPEQDRDDGQWFCDGGYWCQPCPQGRAGDRLWVRETLRRDPATDAWHYAADNAPVQLAEDDPRTMAMILWAHHKEGDTCVSIHMPRWASRITLEITGVRVERLQAISEEDALAEGTQEPSLVPIIGGAAFHERDVFLRLWEKINGKGSVKVDPWVWVVGFKRVQP